MVNENEKRDLEMTRESMRSGLIESIKLVTNLIVLVSTGGIIALISSHSGNISQQNIFPICLFILAIFMLFIACIQNFLRVRKSKLEFDKDFNEYLEGKIQKDSFHYYKRMKDRRVEKFFQFAWKFLPWILCIVSLGLGTIFAIVGFF